MSWLNFNDSLNQIKGQITNFATGVLNEAILQEQDEVVSKTNEDSGSLQELNREAEVRHESDGTKTEEGLRKRIQELEKEKGELVVSLEQLDLDCQRTTENLLVLRDELRADYDSLTVRYEKLELEHAECTTIKSQEDNLQQVREENEKLKTKIDFLEEKLSEFELAAEKSTVVLTRHEELKLQSRQLDEENSKLKEKSSALVLELNNVKESLRKQLEELESSNNEFKQREAKLVEKYECMETDFANVSQSDETMREKIKLEKRMLHETYVKILTENAQKYMESKRAEEEMLLVLPQDELVVEFGKKVENLLKLFLYLKTKTESLENELYEVTEEKNNSILEKNFEIEKLLKNSEILSQEVITKSRIIKDCEAECAELMKNNDALIADLKTYQNNGGLQTISESNEDNLLLLESELLNANQKIKDLEITISDIDNSNRETNLEAQTELDYIKLQLNLTGQELNRSKEDCHELSLRYKKLQEEDSELKFTLEKLRSDYENVEYKCEEAKVNLEALFEENQFYKLEIDKLGGLEKQNKMFTAEMELLKNLVEKSRVESEENDRAAKNLVEKLQNSKMNETKLKLQIDTLFKEAQVLKETNKGLEEENQNLKQVETEMAGTREELLKSDRKNGNLEESNQNLLHDLERTKSELSKMSSEFLTLKWQMENSSGEKVTQEGEQEERFRNENGELQNRIQILEAQVGEAIKSRDEIIALVKVKHEESDRYYKEIQRLTQLLSEESEKSEKINKSHAELMQSFIDERVVLERAVNEKTAAIEKEQSVGKELERLRIHLVDIEETYTRELMDAEQNNKEMQEKLNDIVKREKDSSSIYTSVSIRANQQVETLQKQLQLVTNQRDELNVKLSNYEDQNNKQNAALTNLQLVLDQFQKDKEKDVTRETERIRRQIGVEKNVQENLRKEIASLKSQLDESKQGLQAASRLADQLEKCQLQILNFKEQEKKLLEQLKKSESACEELSTQTDAKVDKTLMKNLMMQYVTSNGGNEEKSQTLKIIATVLDFNRDESDRVNLNKQGGWLKSLIQPQAIPDRDTNNRESLSQAFVRFMEKESKPLELPTLLSSNERERRVSESSIAAPRKSQPLLSEIVLPTFGEFERSRNSGSILKDVLKDNS